MSKLWSEWDLVGQQMPEYEQAVEWLEKNGIRIN